MSTAAPSRPRPSPPAPLPPRALLGWKEILETANPPETRPLDTVGKWLVITRAAVFPMTIWSGLIGGLLAVEAARTGGPPVDWGLFLLAVVGLVLAHAANNMINDYFDTTGGVDTDDYVRALYAPHPILSGWVTKRQLADRDPGGQRRRRRDHALPGRVSAGRSSSSSPWPACSCRCSTSPRRSGSSTTAWASPACSSSGGR